MNNDKARFSLSEVKDMDMVNYLFNLGFEPAKIRGNSYWYYSPLRNENTPSFKVNRAINRWFDFGEGTGGSLIDFGIAFYKCTIGEFIEIVSAGSSVVLPRVETMKNSATSENPVVIIRTRNLSHPALIAYLESRRIPIKVAEKYCDEVYYKIGDKEYFAIGFRNELGGYELRSSISKVSSSPKAVTHIRSSSKNLAVFEGFFDFLSYQVYYAKESKETTDFLILNSLSFFDISIPIMQGYKQTTLYLDRNPPGQRKIEEALSNLESIVDGSKLYIGYEDLNDFLCGKKQEITKAKKPPPEGNSP